MSPHLRRGRRAPLLIAAVALVATSAGVVFADGDPTILEKLADDPSRLRSASTVRDLKGIDTTSLAPLMRAITADPDHDWDVRARALTFLLGPDDQPAAEAFCAQFDPVAVAGDPWGADTFEILAEWAFHSRHGESLTAPLLLRPRPPATVAAILGTLAGSGIPNYLRYLDDHGHAFSPEIIAAVGQTDDQLTRQFVCWWIGEHQPPGMAPYLTEQIASPRTSSYRSQVDRVFIALFTAGIGELIRSAVPTPRWMRDDATPKGLALESLGRYYPAGRALDDKPLVDTLLAAAASNASGKDRGQWQLAVDILFFLDARSEPLAGRADQTAADLVRQVLRKRGPLDPFIAVAELNRRSGFPFPALTADEQRRVWEVASKTLDAAFLVAVVDHLHDRVQREALEQRLLALGGQAARGTLRVVRCWGADIETPGDWATAVSALRLNGAIGDVEGVLKTSWPDEAVEALISFGPEGAPAVARFLSDPEARHIDHDLRLQAIQSCALNLPESEWRALLDHLEIDPAEVAGGP